MANETKAAVMKRKFRASKKWKSFRKRVFDKQKGKCYITGKKLQKRAECHHLDQRAENYKNLDIERFVMLNPMMHEVVHNIYRYWSKDKSILSKIEEVLELMESYSHDLVENCEAEDVEG